MNLAVISDLHIGLAARAKDLCPEPPAIKKADRKKYQEKNEDSYRQQFFRFVEMNEITADYLILPGDITDQAKPQEVEIASEFILQSADALGVAHDKILFTPGNHDVDWSVFDPYDNTGVRWGQRYEPIGHANFHFRRMVDQGYGNIFSSPHFIIWEFEDLFAVGYNSASHDSPVPKNQAHHGLADPQHLVELQQYLRDNIPPDNRKVRLFLVHHHMIDFSAPLPNIPDFSLMTNAEALLNLLHEFDFDLVIHGHKHHPRFDTHSTHIYPHLPILCSGSFSVEIDTQWAGTVDNQFHLVTVNGREGNGNRISGRITSWTNNHCSGWIPSEKNTSGIHHVIPFGSYVMPDELDARLRPFVEERLNRQGFILWKQVARKFPELEHLPIDSAIAAFDRIGQRLGLQRMYENLKDLILYREPDHE